MFFVTVVDDGDDDNDDDVVSDVLLVVIYVVVTRWGVSDRCRCSIFGLLVREAVYALHTYT